MALVTIQRSPSPSNSPESEEDLVDVGSNRQRSFSENYFTVKGAALILPQSDSSQRSSRNNGGDIQQHLQQMFYLLRPEETIKVAVKLETCYQDKKLWRYMAVVCCNGHQDTEESIILGVDLKEKEATIGLVLPIWANTKITLDGDGGFSVNSEGADYLFKPVSVQAMWSALQSLHKVINTASLNNYIPKGLTHTWVEFYKAKINSDVSCIKEWNLMEDIESYAADSPYSTEKQELDTDGMKGQISVRLRELMMSMDLEETTSKELRNSLEASLNMTLIEYKSYIDQEMIRILGQMDAPSEIFPYLYLGSEWNASNYDELEENGVNYILNVSREIDNFFPEKYHYMNVREFDNEQSNLMKHWKRTYEFIKKAKENNGKVLVHCKMGVSRSASTVIAFKMKQDGCSFQEAYNFVKDKRSVIRPNKAFIAQLEEYHGILSASRKRFLFGSKSSSEEVDMENESMFCQLANEARSMSDFTYYEPKDDPRFLPLDDDNGFDSIDNLSDKEDLGDMCEPSQPRVRAYTLDNLSNLPSKFKADDSWITPPQQVGHARRQEQGLRNETNEKLVPCNPTTSEFTIPAGTKASASFKDDLLSKLSSSLHAIPAVSSAVDLRCVGTIDTSLRISPGVSKLGEAKDVKISTPSVSLSVSSDGCPVGAVDNEAHGAVPFDCRHNNNVNNNNNNEAVSQSSKAPFAKDAVPWNQGNVRKQLEKMEGPAPRGGSKPAPDDREMANNHNVGSSEVRKKKDEEEEEAMYLLRKDETHSKQTPGLSSSPSAFSAMHSSPQKLKTSHSYSSFPVADGDEPPGAPADRDMAPAGNPVAERPQSVCLESCGKDFLGNPRREPSSLSVQDSLFGPIAPHPVYLNEDISLPAGIVRRTTKELEEKHRSSCHELSRAGLVHEDKPKNPPVQRSSSLGSERDRPRLERTKRRKTCTPILSPGNFGSSELLFYQQTGLLDCSDYGPHQGQDSNLLSPMFPGVSLEDNPLSSSSDGNKVKDVMVYHYGAEQFEITGGSVRRRMKDYESLAKESEETDSSLENSKPSTSPNSSPGHGNSSKTASPSSPPTTSTTAMKTIATQGVTCSNSIKAPPSVPCTNSSTPAVQVILKKLEEPKDGSVKPPSPNTLNEGLKDSKPCFSRDALTNHSSKPEKEQHLVSVSSAKIETSINDNQSGSAVSIITNINSTNNLSMTTATGTTMTTSSASEEPSILSGCVTKMTQQLEQLSKEAPQNPVKDFASSKSHLFQGAAMSSALDSSFSCQITEKPSRESSAVAANTTGAFGGTTALKKDRDPHLRGADEVGSPLFRFEKMQLMKAKSLDESVLSASEDVAHGGGDGKIVRQLVGKFDPSLVKDTEVDSAAAAARSADNPLGGDRCSSPRTFETPIRIGVSGPLLPASPKKPLTTETKPVLRCPLPSSAASPPSIPNSYGAMQNTSCPHPKPGAAPGSPRHLASLGSAFRHIAQPNTITTTTNTTSSSSSSAYCSVTPTTTKAVTSIAMTTTSVSTATSSTPTSTHTTTTASLSTLAPKPATPNVQSANVRSANVQRWPQNAQCWAGPSEGDPCPGSAATPTVTTTGRPISGEGRSPGSTTTTTKTSTYVTSTLASPAKTTTPQAASVSTIAAPATTTGPHGTPVSAAAAACSSSTSPSPSTVWRPPFMSESCAFLQEGRKVRKLQGKTHPLSKLEGRQYSNRRNANSSFYSTM